MRNCGSVPAVGVLVLMLLGAWAPRVRAQEEADARYEALYEQEYRVSQSAASVVGDFRIIVNRYWNFVRRFPLSGYADNALWQAANLSTEVFTRFDEDRDRFRAIQLFQWLRDQYPHSRYLTTASAQIEQLATMKGKAQPYTSSAPVEQRSGSSDSTVRGVRRDVLPEVVRVTIELDREVPFHHERIESPARLFFDLKGTRTIPALVDATFRYDSDVVRHIRLGRHPNNTVRIVLDLENVGRYSVFTLYNPYRIVIDSDRAVSTPAARHDVETAETEIPPPSPVPEPAAKPLPPATNSSGKFSVARQLGLGVSRVVIDAGHGGQDPGASAFGISEAELVLDVALRLEKLLQQQPGIEVVLTRRTNDYLSLEERTEIANREGADFFLSIHANASANAAASGVETYFLNFALNPQAEAVAARENAASGKTMSSLPDIIKAITLNSKLNESRDFAGSIQRALVRGLRPGNKTVKDLGVKQAPFMVLIGAAMPSVLAEISFVTNRQEARRLKSASYRNSIAEALLDGILRYQASLKKVQTAALQ
jgi:N-acetylmuramoyl-L-alanine amidase